MEPLAACNLRALSSAIEKIYAPTDIGQFSSAILSATMALLPCDRICYNEVDLVQGNGSWITEPAEALPAATLQEMFNRHLHEHPLIAHSGAPGCDGSLRISDFFSQRQFHLLALYNEYYRPLGVEYQVGTEIFTDRDHLVAIGLDRGRPDFSERERLLLDLLRPHLTRSYRDLQVLGLMKREVEGADRQVIAVDRAGNVCAASDDAWHTLSRCFGRGRSPRALPDSLRAWVRHERRRLSDETDIPSPPNPLVVRTEAGRIILRFVWGGTNLDCDLIIMREQRVEHDERPARGQQLTKRETEILSWLSQGLTNAEIGSALSISPATVKKHLEHIYAKLEVRGRSAAIAQALDS